MVWKCHNWAMVFIRWNLMSVSVACWMLSARANNAKKFPLAAIFVT